MDNFYSPNDPPALGHMNSPNCPLSPWEMELLLSFLGKEGSLVRSLSRDINAQTEGGQYNRGTV